MKWQERVFQGVLFYLFLKSLNAWFTWGIDNFFMIFQLLFCVPFVLLNRDWFLFNKYKWNILFYVIAMVLLGFYSLNFGGVMGFFCNVIPLVLFIASRVSFKVSTLEFITRGWLYILLPSLVLFLLSFVINIPHFGQISNSSWDEYVYNNYIIFIKSSFYSFRFNSIFLEPGHVGMIIAFFLFALKFDFKRWEVWGLLLVELFTFSLAGYLLVGLAYVFSLISKKVNIAPLVGSIVFFFGGLYLVAISYDNGNNLINTLIFQRLEFDEEKGVAGNNRFARFADDLVDDKIESGDIWFGIDRNIWEGEFLGAGWKVFLIKYGALPALFFLLFYLSFLFNSIDKQYVLLFVIFVVIAFLQRAYTYWYAWNIPFIAGIALNDYNNWKSIKKYK